ncbi:PREDICTED: heparan-alpha-glucosaminide N-acetyltransferase-like isoform X2 [Eufriesea mexicana]|uniref:heparan-alpha-glucosaminide N-acetyltransferase-like isoform X2 n=1 Tax=Eufriesea mexicana TaxID=516756 RepID=UPI00083C40C2|nr:PREDICTED: heparan-alpha-glucosaminide N-acetyltransferase-like isoform X2 [Eufriesea mexicana]
MLNSSLNSCLNSNFSFEIDQACFSVVNYCSYRVILYLIAEEAYTGNGVPVATLNPHKNKNLVISTKYPLHLYFQTDEPEQTYDHCHTGYTFKEHGKYGWKLSDICNSIYVIHEPTENHLTFMIYILLAILWTLSKVIVQVIRRKLSPNNVHDDWDRLQEAESSTQPVMRITKFSTRIRSVDTFRGISILLMIFVNNGGGQYVFFHHSAWFGLSVADLVLPWFAWIMGLTITISKRAELRVTTLRYKIILRCLRRSVILILLGLMLNSKSSKSLNDLRFPGVLQLLAISYFVCTTLEIIFMKPYSQDTLLQFGRFGMYRDILDSWPQWLIMIGIVTTHTLITFLLPVPNCPTGYFGPGGKYHYRGKYRNCTAGAAGYIDRLIFGNHTYNKTNNFIYDQISRYDPEGLMNTVSAIFIVYLGVHAGKILLLYYQCNSRVIRWSLWAVVTGIIAGILCNFRTEGGVIPVSKNMMTLSYVLTCSSFAFLLYALLYVLIDYKQFWSGAPFTYAGINPIFLYVGDYLMKGLFPWKWNIAHPSHALLLAMNLWTTTLWAIIAYLLYRKDIIITV